MIHLNSELRLNAAHFELRMRKASNFSRRLRRWRGTI